MEIKPKIPKENHNVSKESDSALFMRYLGFFVFFIGSIYLFFFALSFVVSDIISIEKEMEMFDALELGIDDEKSKELQEYYTDIPYKVWYIDEGETENAYASIGGHIYITKAFIDNAISQNEIDFVIGHEIGHVENRDSLRRIIASLPTYIIIGLLGDGFATVIFDSVIANPHSKIQESKADTAGLNYVMKKHGHVGCVLRFFEKHNSGLDNAASLFSGHPMTSARIERVRDAIKSNKYPEENCIPVKL